MLQTGEVDGFGGEIRLDGPSAVTVIIGNGVEPFRHDYDFVDFEVALVGDGLERAPWSARSKTRDQ